MLHDQAYQRIDVEWCSGWRDDHRRTGHQRRQDLDRSDVEPERIFVEHAVRRGQWEGVLKPAHVVEQRGVRNEHSLGQAGRTRCVDDIGGVSSLNNGSRVQRRRLVGRLRVDVQADQAVRILGQPCRQHAGGEDRRRRRVGNLERQAIARRRRVERNIRGAGLENRKQRDRQVDRAFEQQADPHPAADAALAQQVCPLVRPALECLERQLVPVAQHRGGGGRSSGLLRNQVVHALAAGAWATGVSFHPSTTCRRSLEVSILSPAIG